MKKIMSKTEIEKKRQRNQLMVGSILILIMVISTLGYSFMGKKENEEDKSTIIYNGVKFNKQGDFWLANIKGIDFSFIYLPKDLEKTNGNLKGVDNYFGKPLYLFSESKEAEYEIYRNMNNIATRIQYACLNNETCDKNAPIKNCGDNFIIIKKANYSEIEQKENCIFIYSQEQNIIKSADIFLYKILEII